MSALMPETLRKTTKPKNEFNLANQHKAIASICVINKDQYMWMSALMPETNRKNSVAPTVLPKHRQNTSNQMRANTSTSAAQLTTSPGLYTPCPWPLCKLRRSCQNPTLRQSLKKCY